MTTLCSRPIHRNLRYRDIALTLLFALVCAAAPASAQTDFSSPGKQADLEKAYREELDLWLLQAYEGDREAQFKVGVLYTNDQFKQPDFEQAVYWYKQAARQGHALAQYNLGHQYLTGIGVTKNASTAMQWWLKAARLGHTLAQFNVGRAYYLGIGLTEDHAKSRYWFNLAAQNKEPKSIEILQQLGWTDSAPKPAGPDTQTPPSPVTTAATTPDLDSKPVAQDQASDEAIREDIPNTADVAAQQNTTQESVEPTSAVVSKPATEDAHPEAVLAKHPITLYTNPAIRSVLITVIDDQTKLEVIKETEPWSVVSSQQGFPVWVHGDFISVSDDIGTLTGDAVNARSVPIVTRGTIVGKLQRNELVMVLDKHNGWYRIVAPKRFKAWVKTADLKPSKKPLGEATQVSNRSVTNEVETQKPATITQTPTTKPNNDNQWLFAQSAKNYTLQLGSFEDPAQLSAFTSDLKTKDIADLYQFTSQGQSNNLTYFLYGSFPDNKSALKARKKIGYKYAWVRTFGRLQQNRCVAWKKQVPAPKELNAYCVE